MLTAPRPLLPTARGYLIHHSKQARPRQHNRCRGGHGAGQRHPRTPRPHRRTGRLRRLISNPSAATAPPLRRGRASCHAPGLLRPAGAPASSSKPLFASGWEPPGTRGGLRHLGLRLGAQRVQLLLGRVVGSRLQGKLGSRMSEGEGKAGQVGMGWPAQPCKARQVQHRPSQ